MEPSLARRLWTVLEPTHAVLYYAPETREASAAAGLKGGWMAYFAGRAAPLGPVTAEVVTATFYNFAPAMVHRAIPDAWRFSSPARVLEARYDAIDRTLRRLLGGDLAAREVTEAGELARRAIDGCDVAGRPLYAANASLPWPDEPHVALWHAATLLREHRGDGHVASLLSARVDGCEAHVSLASLGQVPASLLRQNRGWREDEWSAAIERLRSRGWVNRDGAATPDGRAAREVIERRTDELALAPFRSLGPEACERLELVAGRVSRTLVDRGGIPFPNPVGVPKMIGQETATPSTRPSR